MNDPQYWIAQGEDVQGPYARSKLRAWIAAGRVRPDMLFSLEGGEWVQGHDCPELFAPEIGGGASSGPPAMPAAQAAPASAAPSRGGGRRRRRPARARGPARRDRDQDDDDGGRGRHARPAGPPGAVMTVVILDFLGVALYGFLGVGAILLVAAAKKDGSTGMIGNMILVGGLFCLVLAAAYLILGIMLKGGSNTARVIQMVLSGLAILFGLNGILQGGVNIGSLIGLALNILIVVLLMGGEASAFFAQSGGGRGGGRRARGGGGGRRRRRRR